MTTSSAAPREPGSNNWLNSVLAPVNNLPKSLQPAVRAYAAVIRS